MLASRVLDGRDRLIPVLLVMLLETDAQLHYPLFSAVGSQFGHIVLDYVIQIGLKLLLEGQNLTLELLI